MLFVALLALLTGLLAWVPDRAATAQAVALNRGEATSSSGVLSLADYPRPPADNGRGVDWFPTVSSERSIVDTYLPLLQKMHIRWVTVLTYYAIIDPRNDYLVQRLKAAGIETVIRMYTPYNDELAALPLLSFVRHYQALGVSYYEIGNEPNLTGHPGGWHDGEEGSPGKFIDYWIPAAQQVLAGGGLPGLPGLSPGGDDRYLVGMLDALGARGTLSLLDRGWAGVHNYTLNHPPFYLKDSNGFLKFRAYARIFRERVGRDLPIISTEGGAQAGADPDGAMLQAGYRMTPDTVARWTVGEYAYMRSAEPYYFATMPWLLGDLAGGGSDPAWEADSWVKASGRQEPVVAAIESLADSPRLPWGQKDSWWQESSHYLPFLTAGGTIYLSILPDEALQQWAIVSQLSPHSDQHLHSWIYFYSGNGRFVRGSAVDIPPRSGMTYAIPVPLLPRITSAYIISQTSVTVLFQDRQRTFTYRALTGGVTEGTIKISDRLLGPLPGQVPTMAYPHIHLPGARRPLPFLVQNSTDEPETIEVSNTQGRSVRIPLGMNETKVLDADRTTIRVRSPFPAGVIVFPQPTLADAGPGEQSGATRSLPAPLPSTHPTLLTPTPETTPPTRGAGQLPPSSSARHPAPETTPPTLGHVQAPLPSSAPIPTLSGPPPLLLPPGEASENTQIRATSPPSVDTGTPLHQNTSWQLAHNINGAVKTLPLANALSDFVTQSAGFAQISPVPVLHSLPETGSSGGSGGNGPADAGAPAPLPQNRKETPPRLDWSIPLLCLLLGLPTLIVLRIGYVARKRRLQGLRP